MTREQKIDEMMEGIAFESDSVIERALSKFASMTDSEINKEYSEWIGE